MNKNSIDKEISNLGVEALMFWELPKVELALAILCRKWFFNACKAYKKIYLDLNKPESDNECANVKSLVKLKLQNLLLIILRIQKSLSLASSKKNWSCGSFAKEQERQS